MTMNDSRELALVLDSRIPLVVIESFDEKRASSLLLRVAKQRQKPVYRWTATDGLVRLSFGPELVAIANHTEPKDILEHIKQTQSPGIYLLCDFHPYLDGEPLHTRLIKDIAQRHHQVANTLVFLSHELTLPDELSRHSAVIDLSLPGDAEVMEIVREEARRWSQASDGARVKTDEDSLEKLVVNLRGLGHADVRRLARGAIVDDGAITEADIPEVNRAKFQLMDMDGVLSFEYDTEKFSNVGGLHNLKHWLSQRRQMFMAEQAAATDLPKGIMLTGVQGGGKSLAAKSIAGLWGVPLLRLDFAALYNKFYGETERNLRDSLKLAELMAPCVLWLDEVEKGLASDQQDGGPSRRVLGTFLTWLAERQSRVFVVATSNDITSLPPELLRKGRLDEIFFVDLPDAATRETIFSIHLKKRQFDPAGFDLSALAQQAEGFSGAEIEQAVVAAVYAASHREPTQATLLDELARTSPLSVVMAEKITGLRQWAEGRTVKA